MLTLNTFVYSFDKNNPPAAHAADGDLVRFLTQDCFGNQIKSEADHEDDLDFTHTNPATGPLFVDGAEVGDVLAVDILDIQVADKGFMMTLEGYGALWPSCELRTTMVPIRDG